MSKIKWKLPGVNEPGFLRRRGEIIELLDAAPTPESMDAVLDYLVPFVDAPEDEAREILKDCSRLEYGEAVINLLGYDYSVPDPKGGNSGPL
jgi:hypothetical protein